MCFVFVGQTPIRRFTLASASTRSTVYECWYDCAACRVCCCHRMSTLQQDMGPPAEEKQRARAFRLLWGRKSELRRFKVSVMLSISRAAVSKSCCVCVSRMGLSMKLLRGTATRHTKDTTLSPLW